MHIRTLSKAKPVEALNVPSILDKFIIFVSILDAVDRIVMNLFGISIGDLLAKDGGAR